MTLSNSVPVPSNYICTKVCLLNLIFLLKIIKIIKKFFKPKFACITNSEVAESTLTTTSCIWSCYQATNWSLLAGCVLRLCSACYVFGKRTNGGTFILLNKQVKCFKSTNTYSPLVSQYPVPCLL